MILKELDNNTGIEGFASTTRFEIGIILSRGKFYYFDNRDRDSCRYYYTRKYLLLKKFCMIAQSDGKLASSFNRIQYLII